MNVVGNKMMEQAREKKKRGRERERRRDEEGKEQLQWSGECRGDDEGLEETGT